MRKGMHVKAGITTVLLVTFSLGLLAPVQAEQVYNARTQRFENRPTRIQIDPRPSDNYGGYSSNYNNGYYQSNAHYSGYNRFDSGVRDFWRSNPVRTGVVGGLVGLGAAAVRGRNLLHGSLVGLATGAGLGLMDDSPYFQAHPLARGVSKGALIGATAASVTGAAALLPAAAVGAGVGAGVHYLKTH